MTNPKFLQLAFACGTLWFSMGSHVGVMADDDHPHKPVVVNMKPHVVRQRVSLVEPSHVLIDRFGNTLIADAGARAVFHVSSDDHVSLLAEQVEGPGGMAIDQEGLVYVALNAAGRTFDGSIVRLTDDGRAELFAAGLTDPVDLAFHPDGDLLVACRAADRIVRVSPDGRVDDFSTGLGKPTSVAVDVDGRIFATSADENALYRILPTGERTMIARGLQTPSDMTFTAGGEIVVTCQGATTLKRVNESGQVTDFVSVPRGTTAVAFDALDNFVVINRNQRSSYRVTANLQFPCPDCGRPTLLQFRAGAKPQSF